MQLRRTEVYLSDYQIPRSFIDGTTLVVLDGEPGGTSRRLLVDVAPGPHVLHYDVARGVRYYAPLRVERGENRLRPSWQESRIPSLYRYAELGEPPVEATRSASYFVYDADLQRIEHSADLAMSLALSPDPEAPDDLTATLSWQIDLDGTPLADEKRSFRHPITAPTPLEETIEIHSDPFQHYWVSIRLVKRFAHLEINSAFLPPPGP